MWRSMLSAWLYLQRGNVFQGLHYIFISIAIPYFDSKTYVLSNKPSLRLSNLRMPSRSPRTNSAVIRRPLLRRRFLPRHSHWRSRNHRSHLGRQTTQGISVQRAILRRFRTRRPPNQRSHLRPAARRSNRFHPSRFSICTNKPQLHRQDSQGHADQPRRRWRPHPQDKKHVGPHAQTELRFRNRPARKPGACASRRSRRKQLRSIYDAHADASPQAQTPFGAPLAPPL